MQEQARNLSDVRNVHVGYVENILSVLTILNFHLFEQLKKCLTGKRFAADAEVTQAVTSILTHTWRLCFLRRDSSVGGTLNSCLYVDGYSAEVSSVPSATHAPCIQSSQNKVFGVRVL